MKDNRKSDLNFEEAGQESGTLWLESKTYLTCFLTNHAAVPPYVFLKILLFIFDCSIFYVAVTHCEKEFTCFIGKFAANFCWGPHPYSSCHGKRPMDVFNFTPPTHPKNVHRGNYQNTSFPIDSRKNPKLVHRVYLRSLIYFQLKLIPRPEFSLSF